MTTLDDDALKRNLTDIPTWLRGLAMVAFSFVAFGVVFVVWCLAGIQFVARLFTGRAMAELRDFGQVLAVYLRQIVDFLVFGSDEKPFPFGKMPRVSCCDNKAETAKPVTGDVIPPDHS